MSSASDSLSARKVTDEIGMVYTGYIVRCLFIVQLYLSMHAMRPDVYLRPGVISRKYSTVYTSTPCYSVNCFRLTSINIAVNPRNNT